jgi:hypothetical protein
MAANLDPTTLRATIANRLQRGEQPDVYMVIELCKVDPVAEHIRTVANQIAINSLKMLVERRIGETNN